MGIAQDASTPAAVDVQGTTGGTVSTASFSPPANSMVVIVATIGYQAGGSAPTVTCADSLANAYTAGPAVFDTLYEGVYIFTRYYSTAPGPITVTVTRTVNLNGAQLEIVPFVLTGVNSSQAGAASLTFSTTTNTTAFNRSFTPTTSGSWVIVAAGMGNTESGTPTIVGLAATDHYISDGTDFVASAVGHFVTGTPTATSLGWTWSQATDYAWAALEILPATATGTPALPEKAAARESLAVAASEVQAESAGAAESIAVVVTSPQVPEAEAAAATDTLSVAVSEALGTADAAAAADGIAVTVTQKVSFLADLFSGTAVNTSLWSAFGTGTVTVSGGTLNLTDVASLAASTGIVSRSTWDLTSSAVFVNLASAGAQQSTTQAVLLITLNSSNTIALFVNNGNLVAQQQVAGVFSTINSAVYSSSAMQWLRIREASGTVFYEYSANGTTWLPLASQADPFALNAITVTLQEGQFGGADPAATSRWASLNVAPVAAPAAAPRLANPAFIRSQMPRMHVQNLLTGAWVHRDVQGITQPSITWSLNAADAFTCTLAPPRADMMDANGNAIITEWRDALYLEENDEIKFGGIITQSTMTGAQWQLTAIGFAGYANGMPYEGADYVVTKTDALDVVRFMWNWLQRQPGGNIGLDLGTAKAGYLLGNQVQAGITTELGRDARAGDTSIWVGNAEAFNRNENVVIGGYGPYTITNVLRDKNGLATGQMQINPALAEAHRQHEAVTQQSPTFTTIARDAASGQNNVWLGAAGAFASGENITIGGDAYKIGTVNTDSNGVPSGNVTITPNTRKAYGRGTKVWQVRTITPFELHWYNSTDIGSEMNSIRDEAIFDWREVHAWADGSRNGVHHQLVFGVPRLGGRKVHLRFAEGENIVPGTQVGRDGTKYANNIIGLGAGSGTAQIHVTASDINTGRLRRTYIYTDQTANTNTRMAAKAQKILTAMKNIDTVTQIVVRNHPNAPFGSFAPGDDIAVILASGWRNTTIWSRITAMTQDPTTDLMTLTLARSDSFTYMPDTGLAGSL